MAKITPVSGQAYNLPYQNNGSHLLIAIQTLPAGTYTLRLLTQNGLSHQGTL